MTHLHLDWETYAAIDIKAVGAYRYAFDSSCEILIGAMAFGDGEPVAWYQGMSDDELQKLEPFFDALEDPSVLIYAHNAQFEMAICQALLEKTWGIPCPALSRFRCTASLARRAALPAKLETLAETLSLPHLKDKRGKALINKFSVMQKPKKPTKKHPNGLPAHRIRPEDDPAAFAEFVEYCRQDVRAEIGVSKALAYFDSEPNNSNYSLDAVINARGVPVNLKALRHAQTLIEEETEIVSAAFRELTGFEVTQGARFLEWLHGEGVHLDNLQAETIEEFLEKYEN
jgi:DNA polymerase bacteriophage-type